MPDPDRRDWWRLVAVAVLVALFMVPVAFMALMGLHAATWTMWGPAGDPPVWPMVLVPKSGDSRSEPVPGPRCRNTGEGVTVLQDPSAGTR